MNSRLWITITLLVSAFVLIVRSSSRNPSDPESGSSESLTQNRSNVLGSDGLPLQRTPTQLFDGENRPDRPTPPENISQVAALDSRQRASAMDAAEVYRAGAKNKRSQKQKRIQSLAGYSQRIVLRSGEGRYQYIPGLFAVPVSEAARLGVDEIDRGAGYVFFEVVPGQMPPPEALPAVVNAETSRLGAVTGVLTVEFKGAVDLSVLARDFQLLAVQSFDHLKVGVMKTERPLEADLVGLLRAVQSDKRVSSAALEIVEHINVPR